MIVLKQELKSNRKTLLIWSLSVGLMIFGFMIMFPGLKDTLKDASESYANMGGFSTAFGLDKLNIGSVMGYYSTEIGSVLALGGALFASLLGAGMLSKEEGSHTAEFLFSFPVSRISIILQKFIAMELIVIAFNLICALLALLSFALIYESIPAKEFTLYHLAQLGMHSEIACICFCISAFLKKSNIGLGLGVALILYFGDIMSRIIPDLKFLKYITPFYYANAADIFTDGYLNVILIVIGLTVSIIAIVIAIIKYKTKDIAS